MRAYNDRLFRANEHFPSNLMWEWNTCVCGSHVDLAMKCKLYRLIVYLNALFFLLHQANAYLINLSRPRIELMVGMCLWFLICRHFFLWLVGNLVNSFTSCNFMPRTFKQLIKKDNDKRMLQLLAKIKCPPNSSRQQKQKKIVFITTNFKFDYSKRTHLIRKDI